MITITGGKLTTWRRMAKMAVDRMVEREFREAPCRTHEIPLGHARRPGELPRRRRASTRQSLHHLADRYGHAAARACSSSAPSGRSSRAPDRRRTCPTCSPRRSFAAAPRAGPHGLADVLLRRTRLGLLARRRLLARRGRRSRAVAQAMAAELGWDDAAREAGAERWRESVDAEGLVTAERRRGLSARCAVPCAMLQHARSLRVELGRDLDAARDGHRQRHARLVLRRRAACRPRVARRARARAVAERRRPDRRRRRVGRHQSRRPCPPRRRSSAWCR